MTCAFWILGHQRDTVDAGIDCGEKLHPKTHRAAPGIANCDKLPQTVESRLHGELKSLAGSLCQFFLWMCRPSWSTATGWRGGPYRGFLSDTSGVVVPGGEQRQEYRVQSGGRLSPFDLTLVILRNGTRTMTFPPLKDTGFPGRDALRQYPKKSCHEQRGGARPLWGVNHEMGSGKNSTDMERMDVTGKWLDILGSDCLR